ncbi:PAS domain S-box protein [Thermodesulfobacteriota bacterium]
MTAKLSYKEMQERVRQLEQEVAGLKEEKIALRETEQSYSQIVHGSPIPTFVIDENHVITHCNKAYENLTGIVAKDVVGTQKQWLTFYASERSVMADLIVDNVPEEVIKEHYGDRYRKSALTEGGYEAEDFFTTLGKNGKWIFFTAAPLRDAEGDIIGAIETLQDITDRKLAEETLRKAERRVRRLLDFLPYPVVVFTLEGLVYYLNPAFTELFGWTRGELEGKRLPYVPPGLEEETREIIHKLLNERVILRHETRRLTKDGKALDVVMRGAVFPEFEDEPAGELIILRDVTREKIVMRNNEAVLRISTALPEYPDLEDLLDYISSEVKKLLDTEGALVMLLDEMKEEVFFQGVSYDDSATERRVREIRFAMDELVAGKVFRTGEPLIVSDVSDDPELHAERDKKLGYHTKNLLLVPVRSYDRIFGVLCAINKKEGSFEQTDVELLTMIAGTVSLSIENARFAEELMKAYREVTSLNKAKDKVINHLSHELKTPGSVLAGSLKILSRKLGDVPGEIWKPSLERAKRNLNRILEIQDEVDDIMRGKDYRIRDLLSLMLDQCKDELEVLISEEVDDGNVIDRIRKKIDNFFGPKESNPQAIQLYDFIKEELKALNSSFQHREVEIATSLEATPLIYIAPDPLKKIIDGLVKNAIENTPDEGLIQVALKTRGEGTELIVQDYGVGIAEEAQKLIFEGFFTTQDTMAYSSKRPFDFNAGGKGADLLRMKVFSERYGFTIDMASSRCPALMEEGDLCPGKISQCAFCKQRESCHRSGGTTFTLYFPPAPE